MTALDPIDVRLAAAQERVAKARRGLDRALAYRRDAEEYVAAAQARLEREHAKRDAVDPVARGHATISKIYDAVKQLGELSEPDALDLDADARPADVQAVEFFNRPGDFHQVDVAIPLDNDELGQKLGARFVVKFTPAEQPLVVEVLRQLRGALNARIVITRMQTAPEKPQDGPPIPMSDFTLGQRYGQRERIADMHGVPPEWVKPANSPTGDTAWTITPPATSSAGRHAKPVYNELDSVHDHVNTGDDDG